MANPRFKRCEEGQPYKLVSAKIPRKLYNRAADVLERNIERQGGGARTIRDLLESALEAEVSRLEKQDAAVARGVGQRHVDGSVGYGGWDGGRPAGGDWEGGL